MNVIGIGNYGLINSNYAKKTSTDEVQVSTSFADIVQNKFNTAEGTMSVGESQTKVYADKPLWHWHDGQFGYSAEVYKHNETDSEYTVKLRYDDGRTEERIVDADAVDSSSCNITDLSVKLYHLQNEGKIENAAPQIVLAHVYMRYRTPNATETTKIDFKGWYQQQLQLELNNNGSSKNISELMKLLNWL
jgi:hypothetical protein|nr:hypothetical protein [uncultured Butyrivibrio sp.]